VTNGQMQRHKLTIDRNLFSLVRVKSHLPEPYGFCLGSAFVKCLQTSVAGVALHIQKGKVASAWPPDIKPISFHVWSD
jgi:hypothetical protein